jgi:hypothetical protein
MEIFIGNSNRNTWMDKRMRCVCSARARMHCVRACVRACFFFVILYLESTIANIAGVVGEAAVVEACSR